MRVHFISGLPRAGSTLLAGILRQNPRFHAAMTSPVGGLVNAAMRAMGPENEFSVFLSDEQRRRVLRSLFDAYYREYDDATVVFDTNRQWSAHLPLIADLFPDSRVIACVRSPAWVVDSLERLHRKNPLSHSKIYGNSAERATVFSRTETVLRPDRIVGYAWQALKEAYYSDEAGRLLLVEYDVLCQRPTEVLALVYRFLGEPSFSHDFSNVVYEAEPYDAKLGAPGLHSVRGPVRFEPRRTVLPPDIFRQCAQMAFWRDGKGTRAHRIVEERPPGTTEQAPRGQDWPDGSTESGVVADAPSRG